MEKKLELEERGLTEVHVKYNEIHGWMVLFKYGKFSYEGPAGSKYQIPPIPDMIRRIESKRIDQLILLISNPEEKLHPIEEAIAHWILREGKI